MSCNSSKLCSTELQFRTGLLKLISKTYFKRNSITPSCKKQLETSTNDDQHNCTCKPKSQVYINQQLVLKIRKT